MAVYKSPKGYTVRYYDADGRERQKTFKGIDREQAPRKERQLLRERDLGERPVDERQAPRFQAFAHAWVELERAAWKASTREQYEQVLRTQLYPHFGDVRVSQITEARIKAARTAWQDGGLSGV